MNHLIPDIMSKLNVSIFKDLSTFLATASQDPAAYVGVKGGFSRTRKLSLSRVAFLILGLLKGGLNIELAVFFEKWVDLSSLCSKSAFCQARQKLCAHFFVAWNHCLVSSFYRLGKEQVLRWEGYRLCAIDGSWLRLPETEELAQHFGRKKHRYGAKTMARLCCCYDVLNQLCLWSVVTPGRIAECQTAITQLAQAQSDMLLIYDRHYPGFEAFYAHQQAQQPFLMRIQRNFTMVKRFLASGATSQAVEYAITPSQVKPLRKKGYQLDKHSTVRLRLIRVELSSGQTEVLVTNLFDRVAYPDAVFAELYHLRWKVETFFERLKHKMGLEAFSGLKVNTIEQDIFAHIFLANIQSLLVEEGKRELAKKERRTQHRYQPNYHMALGWIKRKIPALFHPRKQRKTLEKILHMIIRYKEPVREERSFPRKRKTLAKHHKHRTYLNFKPA